VLSYILPAHLCDIGQGYILRKRRKLSKATVKILGKAVDTQRVPTLMGADRGNADDDGSGA
jgi:hypothetical protein